MSDKKINYYLFLLTFVLYIFFFNFSANASNSKTSSETTKQIISSLLIKAQKAIVAGNPKLAESYWIQAKSFDSTLKQPLWLKNKEKNNSKNTIIITEESKFVKQLHEIPYEKAKIELDKRLLFNPSNNKLRYEYLRLAEKNDDKEEISRQQNILGIKPQNNNNYSIFIKYILILAVSILIIFELISIYKTFLK